MQYRIFPFLLLTACFTGPNPSEISYTVRRGDSLAKIAKAHRVDVNTLRTLNDVEGNLIHPGQVLRIPDSKESGRTVRKRAPSSKRAKIAAASAVTLTMPPKKQCLDGPSVADLTTEQGFVSSQGLSIDQLRTSMNEFLPHTLLCAPESPPPSGTLLVELNVACSGIVASIRVIDAGPYTEEFTSCVANTLRYVAFPPHDMPDGYQFDYPLRFSF